MCELTYTGIAGSDITGITRGALGTATFGTSNGQAHSGGATVTNATAVGNDRIGDSGLAVTADDHINAFIEITGGTGIGQTRRIVDNDTTTFYVDPPFDITPDTTSDFQILSNSIYIHGC